MRQTRRRFLAVFAASTAAAAATVATRGSARTSPITHQRFYALGTEAQITLVGRRKQAEAALKACREEVNAIETAFSIYDPKSMLSHLNRDGKIKSGARFSTLVRHALAMAETTGGAFDPTIQPLWHALATGGDQVQARRKTGWRGLLLTEGEARFARPDMAASFNGIAQGFAADQVSAILAQHGFRDTLVDLGEFAARGTKRERPWYLGIREPSSGRIIARIEPAASSTASAITSAIATSEPRSMLVAGHPHIIDPLERPGERWSSVTVEAREAWRADALSTAIASSPTKQADSLLASGGATRGWLVTGTGVLHEWFANEKAYG